MLKKLSFASEALVVLVVFLQVVALVALWDEVITLKSQIKWVEGFRERMDDVTEVHVFPQGGVLQ